MNRTIALVSGTTVLIGAIAAVAGASAPAARFNPLRVSIVASSNASTFLGAVDVDVTNTSSRIVRVPAWQLPSQFLQAKLFEVTRNGQAVAYEGAMIKRGLPQAREFYILQPGQSIRASVDLSAFYDLSRTGEYTVTLTHRRTGRVTCVVGSVVGVGPSLCVTMYTPGDTHGTIRVVAIHELPESIATILLRPHVLADEALTG